jgi:Domain of unknown function (DUF397)
MSTSPDLANAQWVKSSYSGNGGGNCVEVAPEFATLGAVPVRDSKDPEGPALTFSPAAWQSFVSAVNAEEFGAI